MELRKQGVKAPHCLNISQVARWLHSERLCIDLGQRQSSLGYQLCRADLALGLRGWKTWVKRLVAELLQEAPKKHCAALSVLWSSHPVFFCHLSVS